MFFVGYRQLIVEPECMPTLNGEGMAPVQFAIQDVNLNLRRLRAHGKWVAECADD